MDDHIRLCDDKKIVAFIADLYEKAGVDRETAELHGVGLVEASLRGVDSHGLHGADLRPLGGACHVGGL